METNFFSIVIFLIVLVFDSSLSSNTDNNEDYSQLEKLVQDVDKALKSLIKEKLLDYSQVHRLNRRSVPELKTVLIEAQNKLNEKLLKGQRRIKKFKIQRRSDDSNESNKSNQIEIPLQFAESVQRRNMIPVYRDTLSGHPAITQFNQKSPLNIYYRDVNINDNRMKRDEEDADDMRDTAEEYDEPIPIRGNVDIPEHTPGEKPSANDDQRENQRENDEKSGDYPRLSKFSHTIKHNGRGYHTSYFIPNIDKTTVNINNNKRKDFNSNTNEYWKSETDPKAVKKQVKPEVSYHKTVNEHKPHRPSPRPTQPMVKYSPQISTNAHSYYPFDQPLIRTQEQVIYGTPIPSDLQRELMLHRKPVFQNVDYRPKQYTIPMRDSHQRHNGQHRRQPIFDAEESSTTQRHRQSSKKPDIEPPVHWTKVVAELNEQKSKISEDWRPPKSRQSPLKQTHRDSKDNRFFKVGTSLNMN